jgi:hypothetical protein
MRAERRVRKGSKQNKVGELQHRPEMEIPRAGERAGAYSLDLEFSLGGEIYCALGILTCSGARSSTPFCSELTFSRE